VVVELYQTHKRLKQQLLQTPEPALATAAATEVQQSNSPSKPQRCRSNTLQSNGNGGNNGDGDSEDDEDEPFSPPRTALRRQYDSSFYRSVFTTKPIVYDLASPLSSSLLDDTHSIFAVSPSPSPTRTTIAAAAADNHHHTSATTQFTMAPILLQQPPNSNATPTQTANQPHQEQPQQQDENTAHDHERVSATPHIDYHHHHHDDDDYDATCIIDMIPTSSRFSLRSSSLLEASAASARKTGAKRAFSEITDALDDNGSDIANDREASATAKASSLGGLSMVCVCAPCIVKWNNVLGTQYLTVLLGSHTACKQEATNNASCRHRKYYACVVDIIVVVPMGWQQCAQTT
jgi:hypothetical protein